MVLNIIHTKKVVYTILYICCMVMFAVDVNAQNNKPNKDELQKKIQQKHKEIELTQTFIKENKTKQKTTITLLQTINSQINIRENIIDKTNRQVGVLENEIDTLREENVNLKNQILLTSQINTGTQI